MKIENYFRAIDREWPHQVCIQDAFVPIDHKVGIEPVVQCALATTDSADLNVIVAADHGAGLQTEAGAVFDRVVAVIQPAVQALMEMRHLVAPVYVVIPEDLPFPIPVISVAC